MAEAERASRRAAELLRQLLNYAGKGRQRTLEHLGYTVLLAGHGRQVCTYCSVRSIRSRWYSSIWRCRSWMAPRPWPGSVPKPFAPEQLAQAVALALGPQVT